MSDYWIRANEISSYMYCHRSWWLKRKQGVASQNVRELKAGSKHHRAHGAVVWQTVWTRRLAYSLLFFGVALLTFQFLRVLAG